MSFRSGQYFNQRVILIFYCFQPFLILCIICKCVSFMLYILVYFAFLFLMPYGQMVPKEDQQERQIAYLGQFRDIYLYEYLLWFF